MLGPTGVGALLAGDDAALDALAPFLVGGDTVARTTYASAEFLDAPAKFEAGLQNYAGIAGVAPAVELLRRVGMQDAERHARALVRRGAKALDGVKGLHLVGAPVAERVGIVPLALDKWDPHELAILLEDKHRVLVRSGDHCLHSWFNAKGVPGAVRASTHVYTTEREMDAFTDGVRAILGALG
jgi:cysteine desulfurase/selenocysteine lyase